MKLSEIRTAYEELSGKLSDINRQLCFAGFGVIWIFNKSVEKGLLIPDELYLPSFFLILSLSIDLMQYVISTTSWYVYYLMKRRRGSNDSEVEVNEPERINTFPWALFFMKIISLCIGYFLIAEFLISKIQ